MEFDLDLRLFWVKWIASSIKDCAVIMSCMNIPQFD